jgi:hypothetical protein
MPYITESQRKRVDGRVDFDADYSSGELAYIIYRLLKAHSEPCPTFFDYAQCVGVGVCALLEFWRRKVAVYEDGAIQRNGDV